MQEIDLFNQRLITSEQLDFVQVTNVQRINNENKNLKYIVVVLGLLLMVTLMLSVRYHDKNADTKNNHQ